MITQKQIKDLFQLANAMSDGVVKIEQAFNSNKIKDLKNTKKAILKTKQEMDKILMSVK